jgi:hypothetical protein
VAQEGGVFPFSPAFRAPDAVCPADGIGQGHGGAGGALADLDAGQKVPGPFCLK